MDWGFSAQRATTHRCLQDRCYSYCIPNVKPLLNQRQCQTGVLSGLRKKKVWTAAQSSFEIKVNSEFHLQIKVLESEGRMERHIIQDVWSPVQSLCSLWWFVMACHLLVLVIVFHQVQSQGRRPPGDFYSTSSWPSTCPQYQDHYQLVCWPCYHYVWLTSHLT